MLLSTYRRRDSNLSNAVGTMCDVNLVLRRRKLWVHHLIDERQCRIRSIWVSSSDSPYHTVPKIEELPNVIEILNSHCRSVPDRLGKRGPFGVVFNSLVHTAKLSSNIVSVARHSYGLWSHPELLVCTNYRPSVRFLALCHDLTQALTSHCRVIEGHLTNQISADFTVGTVQQAITITQRFLSLWVSLMQ